MGFAGWLRWKPELLGNTGRSFQSFSSGVSSKEKALPELLILVRVMSGAGPSAARSLV